MYLDILHHGGSRNIRYTNYGNLLIGTHVVLWPAECIRYSMAWSALCIPVSRNTIRYITKFRFLVMYVDIACIYHVTKLYIQIWITYQERKKKQIHL
jgi:hypothetical protein